MMNIGWNDEDDDFPGKENEVGKEEKIEKMRCYKKRKRLRNYLLFLFLLKSYNSVNIYVTC